MVILNQNVIVHTMFIFFLFIYSFSFIVSVQITAQTSFKISLQTKIMVDGANSTVRQWQPFQEMDFKKGCWKKNSCIVVTDLKLQVRVNMQLLHRYTSNNVKISTSKKKKGEAEVVQCPLMERPLKIQEFSIYFQDFVGIPQNTTMFSTRNRDILFLSILIFNRVWESKFFKHK